MQIYIIKVDYKENGKLTDTYIDSVWENKQDAVEHIKICQSKGIFNSDFEPQIVEQTILKHFK